MAHHRSSLRDEYSGCFKILTDLHTLKYHHNFFLYKLFIYHYNIMTALKSIKTQVTKVIIMQKICSNIPAISLKYLDINISILFCINLLV